MISSMGGGEYMIVYKDVLSKLLKAGYTTTRLRREKILSECVLSRIRNNEPISTTTLDKLCQLLDCQPADLMEYVEK